jgi:hypothetical protein
MRSPTVPAVAALVALLVGCSSAESGTGNGTDADASTTADAAAGTDVAPSPEAAGATDGGSDAAEEATRATEARATRAPPTGLRASA